MVNAPSVSLKVIVITHFVLSVWAAMVGAGFLGAPYIYMNAFILVFGVWSIVSPESSEAILMFLILNLISIIMDIIFLAIFTPQGHNNYEVLTINLQGTYRFSLGMAIINLIIKPFTSFVLYRLYQDRGGQYGTDFIPGMPGFGGTGGQGRGGNYENIDQPVPTNTVETASPHSNIDKTSPYGPTP